MTDRFVGFLFKVVLPAFAVWMIFTLPNDIRTAYAASTGHGKPGVFTAEHKNCGGKGGCQWPGDFVSDDGTRIRKNVGLNDYPGGLDEGDMYKTQDTGNRTLVFPRGSNSDWWMAGAFLVGCIGYLIGWAAIMIRNLRAYRRLRARPAPFTVPVAPDPHSTRRPR